MRCGEMPTYEFEIQSLINVRVEADNAEEARMKLVNRKVDFDLDQDIYISDGELVEE